MKYKWVILLLAAISALPVVNVNAQTRINSSVQQQNGAGNLLNYPYGSRLYGNGTISSPRSGLISPSVAVPRGNGSTTYYYPDGTYITIDKNTINPTGTTLYPGMNGGIRDRRLTNPSNFPQRR